MTIHSEPHPLGAYIDADGKPVAGKTVVLVGGHFAGQRFTVEDWADRREGSAWRDSTSSAAAEYAARAAQDGINPASNDVVYGTIGGGFEYLIHASQLPHATE